MRCRAGPLARSKRHVTASCTRTGACAVRLEGGFTPRRAAPSALRPSAASRPRGWAPGCLRARPGRPRALAAKMADEPLYDEFGNYIGPALDSDEEDAPVAAEEVR